jgi:hypothetical protein
MFRRRRLPPPPVTPLGLDDLEAAPRPPLVTRTNLARAGLLFGGGVAWGLLVRFADSLPVDLAFFSFALKVVGGVGFFLALILLLLFRGFEVDRVALIAALGLGGAWIGLAVGPTVPPAVTVAGTFTFAPSVPAGLPASAGAAECEWAAGRWRLGALRTEPLDGLDTPHVLTVDFLRRTIRLANDGGSTLLAVGDDEFQPPVGAPPPGEGDRTGSLDVLVLQADLASTPDDPNEVAGLLAWECPGPP